ncbi:MAG: ABC transporter substrate-binding protein, partial [Anaerolineae bacterium]|nr:ABC transporter substrate-binding protein [Anaerolineae bacterium]
SFVRNEDYNWSSEWQHHQGPAYLDSITFKFIEEDQTRSATLETGEVNLVEVLPPADVARFEGDPNFYVLKQVAGGLPDFSFVNTEKFPTDDLAVRQALAWATDQEVVSEVTYFGVWPPAYAPLSSVTLCYSKEAEIYHYDPEKAKAILEEAGWVDTNGDGIREKDGKPLKILMTREPPWHQYAELLQAQYREVGFDMEIRELASAAYYDFNTRGEANLANQGWISSEPSVFEGCFLSEAADGMGWSKVRDTELDELINTGRKTLDVEKRCEIYAEVQKMIMENVWMIPHYQQTQVLGVRRGIEGIRFDVRGWYLYFYDTYMTE